MRPTECLSAGPLLVRVSLRADHLLKYPTFVAYTTSRSEYNLSWIHRIQTRSLTSTQQ